MMNNEAKHRCCGYHQLFDDIGLQCQLEELVNCGDRPLPGQTTTHKPTTTVKNQIAVAA